MGTAFPRDERGLLQDEAHEMQEDATVGTPLGVGEAGGRMKQRCSRESPSMTTGETILSTVADPFPERDAGKMM
jgi:hypothetical protein